jgi:hypothetical protein
MTIWILCLVLLVCSALAAHRQGAIRATFSFFGILVAAFLATRLDGLLKPMLKFLGVTHPVLLWSIAPLLIFIIVLALFKVAGFAVHRKVEVFYKYKAGDLRLALWERLNSRVGIWVGIANGLGYFVVAVWAIFALGYWTVQVAPSKDEPLLMRALNRMALDLEKTGVTKVAAAVDGMSDSYYGVADVAGLVYQNSLLEARLSRYPGFLSLGERPEFQAIAKDQGLTEMRLRNASVRELLKNQNVDKVVRDPEMVKVIWATVESNLKDLTNFLVTAHSPKYESEPLVGRWLFSDSGSIGAYRREKPNLSASETRRIRQAMNDAFSKAMIVAAPDKKVFLKEFTRASANVAQPRELYAQSGEWRGGDGNYVFTVTEPREEKTARIENERLILRLENFPVAFDKEE